LGDVSACEVGHARQHYDGAEFATYFNVGGASRKQQRVRRLYEDYEAQIQPHSVMGDRIVLVEPDKRAQVIHDGRLNVAKADSKENQKCQAGAQGSLT
jgi:hypothetical protein